MKCRVAFCRHILFYMENLIESQIKFIQVKNNPKFGAFAQGGFGRPGFNMLSNAFQPFFIGGIRLQVPLTHF